VIGQAGVIDFWLAVESNSSPHAASISDLVVSIDTHRVLDTSASIGGIEQREQYILTASIEFTVRKEDVNRTLFGLLPAGNHLISITDKRTGVSSGAFTVSIAESASWQAMVYAVGAAIFLLVLLPIVLLLRGTIVLLLRRRLTARTRRQGKVVTVGASGIFNRSGLIEDGPDGPSIALPTPSVPDSLVTALTENTAFIALGSGASAQAGFPVFRELFVELLQRFSDEIPDGLLRALSGGGQESGPQELSYRVGRGGKAMDAILSVVPRERVAREINDIFSQAATSKNFHLQLVGQPWRGVLALTWDRFAEDLFIRTSSPWLGKTISWRRFMLDDAAELPVAIRSGDRLFLRPLGDLDRAVSLSLTMSEFRRNLSRAPEFQRGLALLLQRQTFLFIGVAADTLEEFLQAVAPELEAGEIRHFALVPDDVTNELWTTTLARFGVQLLPYDPRNDHQAVIEFLSSLSERLRRPSFRSRIVPEETRGQLRCAPIGRLKLTNIGLFETLEVPFRTEPIADTQGVPWTVIFGGNGCGKSTILRAIGVVLAGNDPGATDAAKKLLRTGSRDGSIELQLGSEVLRTYLVRDGSNVIVKSVQMTPVEAGVAIVLGFPPLRGALTPNPLGPAELERRNPEPTDLLPLVSREVDFRLRDFKQWLINALIRAEDQRDSRSVAMRNLINSIIHDIVPGDIEALAPVDRSSFAINVKTADGVEVPFDDLSQGMASIFNWVGILVQRLFDVYTDVTQPEAEAAIALVDEIDAHLHPEWQRKLVELTKKHFPKVQIIATSHSSLLAGSLRGEELCVLVREAGGVTPLPYRVETYGRRSQDILTSPIFGLTTDRNPEAERLIGQYLDRYERAEPTPDEERELADLAGKIEKLKLQHAAIASAPTDQQERGAGGWTTAELDALRRHFNPSEQAATSSRSSKVSPET
jgi:predicted ATP-binding protein involved in virulence